MSLTDRQIKELAVKMNIPLADVVFKDELPEPMQMNEVYIINLENMFDINGEPNDGSHWVMAQIVEYPNKKKEAIYFDPYGAPPPENVKKVMKKSSGLNSIPHTSPDIQSLMNNACGFYCLAMAHFINASQYRSKDLYTDVHNFLEMFDDLNKSVDFKKNEYILKHFFRSTDPKLRQEIDVIKPIDSISSESEKGQTDAFKYSIDVKMMK